jgi:hypothetical protein
MPKRPHSYRSYSFTLSRKDTMEINRESLSKVAVADQRVMK